MWNEESQLATQAVLAARLHRASRLMAGLREKASAPLFQSIERHFASTFGVSADDFFRMQPALHSSWLVSEKGAPPGFAVEASEADSGLVAVLRRLALSAPAYEARLKSAVDSEDPLSVRRSVLRRTLSRFPFLMLEDQTFVLLGPHLLLRQMDLAIEQAYIEAKPRNENPNEFYGALGDAAEDYALSLLKLCVSRSRGVNEGMAVRPPADSGLSDFLIVNPDFAIVFEVKNRKPPLTCFEPTQESHDEFASWLDRNYFASKLEVQGTGERPGAIEQLSRACGLLLSRGYDGVKPKRVYPVVINPQYMVFSYNFNSIADEVVREKGFFGGDKRVAPLAALGLGSLELLSGCDFGSDGFSSILRLKADDASARQTTWPVVLNRRSVRSEIAEPFARTLEEAFDHCAREVAGGRMRASFLK